MIWFGFFPCAWRSCFESWRNGRFVMALSSCLLAAEPQQWKARIIGWKTRKKLKEKNWIAPSEAGAVLWSSNSKYCDPLEDFFLQFSWDFKLFESLIEFRKLIFKVLRLGFWLTLTALESSNYLHRSAVESWHRFILLKFHQAPTAPLGFSNHRYERKCINENRKLWISPLRLRQRREKVNSSRAKFFRCRPRRLLSLLFVWVISILVAPMLGPRAREKSERYDFALYLMANHNLNDKQAKALGERNFCCLGETRPGKQFSC